MPTENQLPHSAPEAQGIASAAVLAFVNAVEAQIQDLHSFMLLRHGHVVAEGWWSPYGPEDPHMLFSLSKSFTSTAVGLAVAEGRLTVEDRVISFFPQDVPTEIGENLALMRVHDLLAMATGHAEDTTRYLREREDGNWVKAFLARPVDHTPGTHFVYNSGATYMLAAIVQQLTGMTLLDYLQPRLFAPLGIANATWESCPRGVNVGGWGLKITTAAIARFGQMYLQQGMWHDQSLVPATWVAAATSYQVAHDHEKNIDWAQGYGYQFWRCQHGAYRGDGAFGQFCIVMPDQDAVLAITSGVGDMQAVLNLVWAHLRPAMAPTPLTDDKTAQTQLAQKLANLCLPTVPGERTSPLAAAVTGRTYQFDLSEQPAATPNTPQVATVRLEFAGDTCTLTRRDSNGEQQVTAGNGAWHKGKTTLPYGASQPLAASGAWITPDTYMLKTYFYETPFCTTATYRFSGDQLFFSDKLNVSFGPTNFPQLVGQRV